MCKTTQELIEEYSKSKTTSEESKEILEKLKQLGPTVDDHVACKESNVCFVFSCPGRVEMIKNKVCAGSTGKNLDIVIANLKKQDNINFPYDCRYAYHIINASDKVHFEKLDGKTQENIRIIKNGDNIERVKNFLKAHSEINVVILFGKKACVLKKGIEKDFSEYIIINEPHLSPQSVNSLAFKKYSKQSSMNGKQNISKFLESIADDIIAQLKTDVAQASGN